MEISLSVLNLDDNNQILQDQETIVSKLHYFEDLGITSFHVDVTDGIYAGDDNIQKMYMMSNLIYQSSIMKKEVHLMCKDILRNVDLFAQTSPDTIYFQLEALENHLEDYESVLKIVESIRRYGIKVGIAICNKTDIFKLKNHHLILPYVSKLLYMTVVPGYGGQKYLDKSSLRIVKLKEQLDKTYPHIQLYVDGGITHIQTRFLKDYVDGVVVGSALTKSKHKQLSYKKIKGDTMLVNTKEMLLHAKEHKYAVGAFNFTNLETLQGIIEAANKTNSPVILQTSKSAIEYMGMDYIISMIEAVEKIATVPFALHLDHGADFEIAKACIDAGYTSVMIDASSKPFEENVALTKKVVEYAHQFGVTVEAEIGALAGVEDEVVVDENSSFYTDPQQAKEFVELTGCDSLAIAIGTSHGATKFKGEPRLRFDLLEQISKLLPETPLVLHGASSVIPELVQECNEFGGKIKDAKGCPDALLQKAAKTGISKINVDTDLRLAMTAKVRRVFEESPEVFDMRKYIGAGRKEITKVVENKMENIFYSSDFLNK